MNKWPTLSFNFPPFPALIPICHILGHSVHWMHRPFWALTKLSSHVHPPDDSHAAPHGSSLYINAQLGSQAAPHFSHFSFMGQRPCGIVVGLIVVVAKSCCALVVPG
jgi:hypothetical protein